MSIKLADTLAPMADFPAAMAEHIEFDDGESLQQKLDDGSLGGGDGADVEFDDMPTENSDNAVKSDGIFKALGDKQDNIIILEGYKTQEEDGFGNYIINPAPNYTNRELIEMLDLKKRVVLRIYNGMTWVELYPVRNGNSTATYFVSPVWNTEKEIQELNVAFCSSTAGWKIGVNPVVGVPRGGTQGQVLTKISDEDGEVEWSGSSPEPFIIKSSYTDTSEGFVVDTSNTVPVMWSDWYEHYLTGRQIIWELHKNTIDSGDDVIKMYINSIGIYDKSSNVLEAQFTGVGTPTRYNTLNTNLSKFLYVAWFRSGSNAATNYKKVKRFLINEIPTGGTTGQILAKKSDANYDVEWADVGGGGGGAVIDDAPTENSDNAVKSGGVFEALGGKQNATIFVDATMSTVKDSWDNYLLDVDEEYRYSKVQDMLVNGKTVILRVKVDGVLVELPCVSYESYTNATLTFAAPYYNSSTGEKGSYIAFCASTVGWKLGIKVVKEASSTDMSPFIIKSAYTEDSNGFTIDTKTTTPELWDDWYPAFEAGRPVYWDLHKHSIDSNKDVIRLYPHSHGIYYESTGTKECQFTSIGGYPNYDSRNNSTKYFYIGWFRSGSSPISNYKFVKQYKIGEIPTGGTTGQALVKKSDINGDVQWIDMSVGGLVVTGNYLIDDDDNWTVSNISETFANIDKAISDNQDVVLKIYPEGDTTNPYILYPAMHYANMGTAFSLMVSDEGQISGLSVMITKDNQVMATRNEYDFEALKKSVSDGKTLVAGAITGKGIETAADAEFATMAENIGKIESNTPLTLKHSNITNTNFTNTTVCGNGVIVAFRDNLLYCSHDGGVTWKTTSLDMTNATNNCTMVYAEKHDIFIACISGMGIYTSYDGDNWTLRLSSTQANKLYYDTTTGICLAGSTVGTGSSGLWYSVNGYTWSTDSRQASKKVTYLGGAGGRLYAVIGGASYVSSDGYNWSTITAFSQYAISVIKYEQGLYMACILGVNQNKSWYYSYDGINFTQASVTFTGTTYGVGFNDMKRISTETWVVALYTGIYYTTNRGRAWSVSNLGTSTGNWAFFAYKEKFYAGSCGGPGTTYGGIQYSTDGKTWSATTGISGANFKFYCVNDRLFASCSTGVYLLNSDGISWTQIIEISDIIYGDNDILITAGGSYSTNGIDWKDIDISNLDITSFNISKVYRCGSNLVVASTTSSNGMFYATLLK